MSARTRVFTVAGLAAAVVIAAVVGVTLLQTRGETTAAAGSVSKPRAGTPPLLFDFGVRADAESQSLARGAELLKQGNRAAAQAIFARDRSLQGQIGAAFARWPDGSLDAVKHLVATHPHSPVAQLHLALALYWSGRNADAVKAFQQVDGRFPDSPSAVDAEDILYANRYVPGLPYMIGPVELPQAPDLAAQLAAAKNSPLASGVMLWRLDRRISARRALDRAAAAAPDDPLVLAFDAVSHFTKKDPTPAFARLGPLTSRFPRAAVVRLELGLLLLWRKEVQKGTHQLQLAAAAQPGSVYAVEAKKLLSALVPNGTK